MTAGACLRRSFLLFSFVLGSHSFYLLCLRRPYLFPLAGKDMEEKNARTRGACRGMSTSEPNLQDVTNHTIHTFRHPTTRRLFGKNQICKQLRLFRCKQSAVQSKSGTLYGFAEAFQFSALRVKSKAVACLFLGSITPQKIEYVPNSICQIFNGHPLKTKTQTSEAFVFWKGRATQWTSFRARAEARNMEFVRTLPGRAFGLRNV